MGEEELCRNGGYFPQNHVLIPVSYEVDQLGVLDRNRASFDPRECNETMLWDYCYF